MGKVNGFLGRALRVGANCRPYGKITIPEGVTTIGEFCFFSSSITEVTIPESITTIGGNSFNSATSLTTVTVKGTSVTFQNCFTNNPALTTFNTVSGFNPTSLSLNSSTGIPNISHDSMLSMFNNLATIATTKQIVLGSTNLARMSAAEKAIATGKGWTLA